MIREIVNAIDNSDFVHAVWTNCDGWLPQTMLMAERLELDKWVYRIVNCYDSNIFDVIDADGQPDTFKAVFNEKLHDERNDWSELLYKTNDEFIDFLANTAYRNRDYGFKYRVAVRGY